MVKVQKLPSGQLVVTIPKVLAEYECLEKGTEVEFKKHRLGCSATYLKARNKLIEVGLIKQKKRGGMCRGDMAEYKLLFTDDCLSTEMRWIKYPEENWAHEIPKRKKQLVGVKTQWKKGQSGRKTKPTLIK